MILNVWTVLALFLAAAGAGLGLAAGAIALRGLVEIRCGLPAGGRETEDRAHLLGLVIGVLIGVRLVAWPHFYFLMKSYVPELAPFGVMCVFGVTRIQPRLVSLLQALKPILLACMGFWWVLFIAGQRARTRALLPGCVLLVLPLAGIVLLDCAAEVAYLLSEKVGQPVTCCTQFTDTKAIRVASEVSPLPFVGLVAPQSIMLVYYLSSAAVIGGAVWLHLRWKPIGERKVSALWLPLGLAAVAAWSLLVTHRAWIEALAPRVLQLPYHHCLYELLTGAPVLGLAAVLTLAANACLLWPLALELWARRAPEAISGLQTRIYGLSAVLLTSALLIVAVHWV